MNLRILVLAILATPLSFSAQAESAKNCVHARVALDVGSSSTKIRSALVDACKNKIIAQWGEPKAKVSFNENLARDNSDGGFEATFIDQATAKILVASEVAKADLVRHLKTDPELSAYSPLANFPIEVGGGGTEALRKANNTPLFIEKMSKVGLRVRKLEQVDEGKVGFLGVEDLTHEDPNNFIAFDIGSASMQITGDDTTTGSDNWSGINDKLASNPMLKFILTEFLKKPATDAAGKLQSPNPILPFGSTSKKDLLAAADNFVRGVPNSPAGGTWAIERLHSSHPPKVYGLGGLHGGILSVVQTVPGRDGAKSYTIADLTAILRDVLFVGNNYLVNKYKVPEQFASNAVTNMLLVYTVMKELGMTEVTVVDVDNTPGELISPSFWTAAN